MRKLILIDFSWLYNKYYYTAKYSIALNGDEKGLKLAVLRMLKQFLELVHKSYSDAKVILALDSPTTSLKNFSLFEGYKQNRNKEEKKEVYAFLDEILIELIKTLDSKVFYFIREKLYESDQLLSYIVKKYKNSSTSILIYSGDKDFLQLSAYNNVFISDKFEKGKFLVKTDEEIFQKFKNSKGEDFTRISTNKKDILKYRVLKGDVSDNLSPVFPRIRDKEIINIIQNYWVGDEVLDENYVDYMIDEIRHDNVALADKLEYNKATWIRNYKIMDLYHIEDIKYKRLVY